MPSSTVYGAKAYLLTGDRHTSYSLTPGLDSYGDACRIAENVSRMPGVSYTEAGGFEYEGAELTAGCRFVGGAAVNLEAPLPGGPAGPPRGTLTLVTDPDHAPGHGFSLEVLLAVVAELDRTTCQGREPCLGDYIASVIRALTDLEEASRFTAGEPLQYLEPGDADRAMGAWHVRGLPGRNRGHQSDRVRPQRCGAPRPDPAVPVAPAPGASAALLGDQHSLMTIHRHASRRRRGPARVRG